MNTLEAIKAMQDLGYSINIFSDWSGSISNTQGRVASFVGQSSFLRQAEELNTKASRANHAKDFVRNANVRVLRDTGYAKKGDTGVVLLYDRGDDTAEVRFAKTSWWVKCSDLEIIPFVVKDDVKDEDDEQGIIVSFNDDDDDDAPYLVYWFESDCTTWCSADELTKV